MGLFVLCVGLCAAPWVDSADLADTFRLALENDPQYLSAGAELRANQELRPQARALLLPNLSFDAQVAGNRLDVSRSPFGPTGIRRFNDKVLSVSLTQPIFRRGLWVQFEQAGKQVEQAEVRFAFARQDLILRVAEVYFDVLRAIDSLRFARAEKEALAKQLDQAQQRFDVGLIAITDVQEAKAGFDSARADEIAAINQLNNATEALRAITGQYFTDLEPLGQRLPLVPPEPNDIDEWTDIGLEQNLQIAIAQLAVEISDKEIKRAQSGHLPTLDLVGTHSFTDSGGGVFGGSETSLSALELQLNLPIYEGGLVLSQTREARASYQQALDELLGERRETQRQTRDAFLGILTGISRVEALRQAVVSAEVAKEAIDAGFQVGTRTAVDVVASTRDLTRQQRDLAFARYDYLLNILRLKLAAGILSDEDLVEINQLLDSSS